MIAAGTVPSFLSIMAATSPRVQFPQILGEWTQDGF